MHRSLHSGKPCGGEGGVQASKGVGGGRTDSTLAGGGGAYDAILSYF
jgi:hypothetical protein